MRQALERPGLDRVDQLGEGRDAGLETLRVEGEGCVVVADVDVARGEDVAFVDPVRQRVPGDAVICFAGQNGPGGRVQSGVVRKRAVVEVGRTFAGSAPGVARDQAQVRDAEEPVVVVGGERIRETAAGGERGNPMRPRPGCDLVVCGYNRADVMAAIAEGFATLDQKRLVAHHHACKFFPRADHITSSNR